MLDIEFDFVKREIVMTGIGDTSDCVLTANPSVQNGGILLTSRCAVLGSPMSGAGVLEQVMGGHASDATFELNRWKAMAVKDGATGARWNASVTPQGKLFLETIDINYL